MTSNAQQNRFFANTRGRAACLVHETLGGFSPHAARRLRLLGRAAARHGHDATDYTRSYTARSFVPHFAQRISSACVLHGAAGMIKYLSKLRKARLEAPGAAGHKA